MNNINFSKTITILGTKWTLRVCTCDEEPVLSKFNCDGFTDWSQKLIVLKYYKRDESTIKNGLEVYKECARHEIVHAFMFESGLGSNWQHPTDFGQDETTVDWIAHQFHKMKDVISEVEKMLEESGLCDEF